MTDEKHIEDELAPVFPKGEEKVKESSHIEVIEEQSDGIKVLVTSVYCPNGHNLISPENDKFDGYPGIKLLIEAEGRRGIVTLSPFHGDKRKTGMTDIKEGTNCKIMCPVCEVEMPVVTTCSCEHHGNIHAIYLTPKLDQGEAVGICSIWGCPRSRIIDNFEIISEIILTEQDEKNREDV